MPKKTSWEHESNLRVPLYTYLASGFLGATAILFLIVGFFAISRGRIFITFKTGSLPIDLPVTIKPLPKAGEVFGLVREITVEGQKTAPVPQGATTVGKAAGQVTIFNTSSIPQTLVATTRLLSPDNILFRITSKVTVPAHGQISVAALADQSGKESEIEAATFSIPGLNPARRKEIYAKNTAKMIAPVETTSAVTADLINQTSTALQKELLEKAWQDMQKIPAPTDTAQTMPPFQKNLLDGKIVSQKNSAPVGAKVNEVTVSLNLKVRAVAVEPTQIKNLALQKIQESLPQTKTTSLADDALTLSIVSTSLNPEMATLRLKTSAPTQMKITDPVLAKTNFFRLSKDAVQKYLSEIPDIEKAEVKISPFWVNTMPASVNRIKIFFLNAL